MMFDANIIAISIEEHSLISNRIVLVKKTHNILSVVGHIFADHEREVTTLDHLVVLHGRSNLVASPVRVGGIRESVVVRYKHGNRHLCDVLKRNKISVFFLE